LLKLNDKHEVMAGRGKPWAKCGNVNEPIEGLQSALIVKKCMI